MIHANKRFVISTFIVCVISLLLSGCGTESGNNNPEEINSNIVLNKGSVLKSEEGKYNVYDYKNNEYEKISNDSVIIEYSRKNGIYIENKNNENYLVCNGKENRIPDENFDGLKLSPQGNYASYFIDNNGLKMKVINSYENNMMAVNSDVSISGILYDWYDDHTLVYYGVDNEKVNGIFTYDLRAGKEELLYEIHDGFVSFIKSLRNHIVFVQINMENEKELMMLNKNSKNLDVLTQNLEEIYDIAENERNIYFIGRMHDNAYSVYKIENSDIKRVVYDFPSNIKYSKGICVDDNNNVLFVGADSESSNEEKIYMIGADDSVSVISEGAIDYAFVHYVE